MLVIGTYRISYNNDIYVVPVTDAGVLLMPDGKTIVLTKPQFEEVKKQLKTREKELLNARPYFYVDAANDKEKAEAIVEGNGEPIVQEAPHASNIMGVNPDLPAESKEKNITLPNNITRKQKKELQKQKKRDDKLEKRKRALEDAKKKAEIRQLKKQVEEPIRKETVIVIALASALLTLLIILTLFLYLTGNGTIVVNPKWNGLLIYDDARSSQTVWSQSISQ